MIALGKTLPDSPGMEFFFVSFFCQILLMFPAQMKILWKIGQMLSSQGQQVLENRRFVIYFLGSIAIQIASLKSVVLDNNKAYSDVYHSFEASSCPLFFFFFFYNKKPAFNHSFVDWSCSVFFFSSLLKKKREKEKLFTRLFVWTFW